MDFKLFQVIFLFCVVWSFFYRNFELPTSWHGVLVKIALENTGNVIKIVSIYIVRYGYLFTQTIFSATVKTAESGWVGYNPVLSYWQPSCFTYSRWHPEQIHLTCCQRISKMNIWPEIKVSWLTVLECIKTVRVFKSCLSFDCTKIGIDCEKNKKINWKGWTINCVFVWTKMFAILADRLITEIKIWIYEFLALNSLKLKQFIKQNNVLTARYLKLRWLKPRSSSQFSF